MPTIVGDCGVCGDTLNFGENHAFTVCKHLFCVSCLLKWHSNSANATCPLCRTKLYESDPDPEYEYEHEHEHEHEFNSESEPESHASAHFQIANTNRILRELDFDRHESVMHQHMMEIIEHQAIQHCNESEFECVFMGDVNLHVIPSYETEHDYQRIEVECATPNAHYIIILSGTSSVADEFRRCRFGRIEEIQFHPMFPDVKWFAFRERISVIDEERGEHTTQWANETLQLKLHETVLMVQYIPRIRVNV